MKVGWGVKFVLDEGDVSQQTMIDTTQPYEVTFSNVARGEHSIDCIDESQNVQLGDENYDTATNIAIGDILIALGDSITFSYGDDFASDNISADGRNTGGGFEPILNDHLSGISCYSHPHSNERISGGKIQEGLARLPSVLAKHTGASTFLVLHGTNDTGTAFESGKGLNIGDIGYDGTYKDYMQQMIDMVNRCRSKDSNSKDTLYYLRIII